MSDELTVWVVETHSGHGEDADVLGVYRSREAAWDAIKALPDVTAYMDGNGNVRGRPKNEGRPNSVMRPRYYAWGHPMTVQDRTGTDPVP